MRVCSTQVCAQMQPGLQARIHPRCTRTLALCVLNRRKLLLDCLIDAQPIVRAAACRR